MTTKPDNDNQPPKATLGNRFYLWLVVALWLGVIAVPMIIGLYIRYSQ